MSCQSLVKLNIQTIISRLNNIFAAAHSRRHASQSTCHCLQKSVWHTFPARGKHADRPPVQLRWYISLLTSKLNAICDAESTSHTLNLGSNCTTTNNN